MSTLLVNSVPASVLFDSGASHSFMSEDFAYKHDVKCEEMNTSVLVKTPWGNVKPHWLASTSPWKSKGWNSASPIILKSSNIDLILGMDWLKAHTASIVCATKTVHPLLQDAANATLRLETLR